MTILSVSKTQSGSSPLAPLLTTLCFQCMQRLTMVKIVFIGFCDLLTIFGTYEQFISVLWNDFFIDNVRKS